MLKSIDAKQLKEMFAASHKAIKAKEEMLNNLNVYPVPDGDTGTNMALTMEEVSNHLDDVSKLNLKNLAKQVAESSLMGARGNSGVILSQFIGGFAEILKKHSEIKTETLLAAFQKGTDEAYSSVSKPVEGTILTIMKAATKEIEDKKSIDDIQSVLKSAINRSQFTLKRTPDMLPKLKDAGVVDAGGAGFVYFLEGFYNAIAEDGQGHVTATDDFSTPQLARVWSDNIGVFGTGGVRSIVDFNIKALKFTIRNVYWLIKQGWKVLKMGKNLISLRKAVRVVRKMSNELKWQNIKDSNISITKFFQAWQSPPEDNYCYEVILTDVSKSADEIKSELKKVGSSLIVAQKGKYTKIHFHVKDKDEANKIVKTFGNIEKEKIDNLQEQHKSFLFKKVNAEAEQKNGTHVLAVVNGEGFDKIYKSFEGVSTIDGGTTMNPSVADFNDKLNEIDEKYIVIIPNNKNVFLTARKVSENSDKKIDVIETTDQAEGLHALINFNPELTLKKNMSILKSSLNNITTFSVTKSTRDTKNNGKSIKKGQYIAVSKEKILSSTSDLKNAVKDALEEISKAQLITIFFGNEINKKSALELKQFLSKSYPVEYQVYDGGQPSYDFIISVE